jgi:(+)-trans-carveol dehydrogenase
MTGRVEGKVAFVTGAARGQGRSHAVRLAQEGADIIAVDICQPFDNSPAPAATSEDLLETAEAVKGLGRCIVISEVDVRDYDSLKAAVDSGVEQLGGLGGSIILTSSVAGLKTYPHTGHYVAAKHGVVGLMRTFAVELGAQSIRVNSVHPTHVNTPLLHNEKTYRMFRPDLENPGPDDMAPVCQTFHMLPIPWVTAEDISNAVLFLASDEARYITGVALPVDAGSCLK